ncbi:MAG: DHHA1 domain-containing protein, partial [Myxococcota bacterium]
IRALMDVSRVRAPRCGSTDVGFRLGPRINAAGRLDDATVGVRLLLAKRMEEARKLAETLDVANGNRQRIEADVYYEAVRRIDALSGLPDAIVLADADWHPGVVGIVCSKLVERYDRPAILIGEGGRGSARTARGLHLYNALNDCRDFLSKFGGHRAAAGFRIPSVNIESFTSAFVDRVTKDPDWGQKTESTLIYDDEIRPEEIDRDCFFAIRQLEPFGTGNPQPLFRVPAARIKRAARVGNDHLKLRLQEGHFGGLEAIAFKRGELYTELAPGDAIELAAHLDLNEYAGLESLQLRVRDLRAL